MSSEESGESLAEKLVVYRGQLAAVEAVLAADPSNEQYLTVRGDLVKLIVLTSDLHDAIVQGGGGNDDDDDDDDDDDEGPVEGGAASSFANDANNDFDDDDDDDLSADGVASGLIAVGDAVEVRGDDRLFSAVLTAINSSEGTCGVRYFEYGTSATLQLGSVSKIAPGPFAQREQLPLGFECLCKYAADQKYYDGVVKSHSPDGIVVTYTLYGNSEEVPIQYIKSRKGKKSKEGAAKPDIAQLFAPKTIKIPQKFIVLPTDTEEEKAKKRRGLKSIKSKNRLIEKEATLVQGQQSWQQFKNKGGKAVVAKTSMFSSDKTKSVTSYAERKKHVFT